MTGALLEIVDLVVTYSTAGGAVRAADGVSLEVGRGETVGLVGESGCGKTTVGRAIIRVLPPNGRIAAGAIRLEGRDLVPLPESAMRAVRWRRISLVPQSAMNALNPVHRVGRQIEEVLREHQGLAAGPARRRAEELLALVRIDPARANDFPHQWSGGMRQRALVAMALALSPSMVIADEPTTALDVISQDRIFARIRDLSRKAGASMLLITHDMGLVAENCDRVAVMYGGKIVESGDTLSVFSAARHPYTLGLRNAFPSLARPREQALIAIPGVPVGLDRPPPGCRFAARCPFVTEVCRVEEPRLREFERGHLAACHHADDAERMRQRAADSATWEAVR